MTTKTEEINQSKGSDFIAPNSERAIEEAAAAGLEVVFPEDNQLQVDIDDEASMYVFNNHIDIVRKYMGELSYTVASSKSGENGKYHVTVTLKHGKLDPAQRIALQACLGSDRKREILSYIQYLEKDAHPTLFLEWPKQKLLTDKATA